jgi:hypothetical protein
LRREDDLANGDETEWMYHLERGRLWYQLDDAENGPCYTYTVALTLHRYHDAYGRPLSLELKSSSATDCTTA